MPRPLNSRAQLALLLGAQASLALWLNLPVPINVTLQHLDILVVKIRHVVLKSFVLHSYSPVEGVLPVGPRLLLSKEYVDKAGAAPPTVIPLINVASGQQFSR